MTSSIRNPDCKQIAASRRNASIWKLSNHDNLKPRFKCTFGCSLSEQARAISRRTAGPGASVSPQSRLFTIHTQRSVPCRCRSCAVSLHRGITFLRLLIFLDHLLQILHVHRTARAALAQLVMHHFFELLLISHQMLKCDQTWHDRLQTHGKAALCSVEH